MRSQSECDTTQAQHGGSEPSQKGAVLRQTSMEEVRAATKAAAAIRAPPTVVSVRSLEAQEKQERRKGRLWRTMSRVNDVPLQPAFNPELLTNQKREWTYLQRHNAAKQEQSEPKRLFEHFVVVGLPPTADVEAVVAAFKQRKLSEGRERAERAGESRDYRGPSTPSLEPEILFQYPPRKRLALRDLPGFCFPNGVQARVMERTPSMSDFNQVVYGQAHLKRDDHSFVFLLKVASNETLYGVCMWVQEIVQRPPGILALNSESVHGPPLSKFLVAAPRCYCLLTQLPFFELHFEVLNGIISQERLDRIKYYMHDMDISPRLPQSQNRGENAWMNAAIPVESMGGGTAHGGAFCTTDCSDCGSMGSAEGESDRELGELGEGGRGNDSPPGSGLSQSTISSDSLTSGLDGCDLTGELDDYGASDVRKWAELNNNDALRLVCAYHMSCVPERGASWMFQPLDHLQPIGFIREPAVLLPLSAKSADLTDSPNFIRKEAALGFHTTAVLRNAEEAKYAAPWAVATMCRFLSLENILAMLEAALLERQMVIICPNLGVLSAIVISLIPMLRPFIWQSVLLPILPSDLLAFLDAPVPFIVGLQYKTAEVRSKTSHVIRVNVYKDNVKVPSPSPPIPLRAQIRAALQPIHGRLAADFEAGRQPVHRASGEQAALARKFLKIIREFLETFCANLELHTITDVRPGGERVSLLLKDSFVASFPPKDRSFMKHFSETQLFAVHSDAVLSTSEVEA